MCSPISVHPDDDLRRALEVMLANGIREVPVTDAAGCFLGFIDEAAIASAYVRPSPSPDPLESTQALK